MTNRLLLSIRQTVNKRRSQWEWNKTTRSTPRETDASEKAEEKTPSEKGDETIDDEFRVRIVFPPKW